MNNLSPGSTQLLHRGGRFITLEGGDGSGKSVQAARLAAGLRAAGRTVVTVADPGGTPAGEAIRRLLLETRPGGDALDRYSETFLYLASRRQLVTAVIRPALAAGHLVISDRFTDSTLAYQGHARRLPRATLEPLCALAADGLIPDLTLWLDLPPAAALGRVGTADRLEAEGLAFQEAVREGYRRLAALDPGRIRRIDARGDPDTVFGRIRRAVTAAGLDGGRKRAPGEDDR